MKVFLVLVMIAYLLALAILLRCLRFRFIVGFDLRCSREVFEFKEVLRVYFTLHKE